MSAPKRCTHTISINVDFIKKLLENENRGLSYANTETLIRFRNDIHTIEDMKKLANFLLVHAADIHKVNNEKIQDKEKVV